MSKKLYRSTTDRKLTGVLGGVAEYFGMDATLIRIIFVLLLIFTGFMPMGLIYLVAIFVMPKAEGENH